MEILLASFVSCFLASNEGLGRPIMLLCVGLKGPVGDGRLRTSRLILTVVSTSHSPLFCFFVF